MEETKTKGSFIVAMERAHRGDGFAVLATFFFMPQLLKFYVVIALLLPYKATKYGASLKCLFFYIDIYSIY